MVIILKRFKRDNINFRDKLRKSYNLIIQRDRKKDNLRQGYKMPNAGLGHTSREPSLTTKCRKSIQIT